jgi:hypothetical protein
MMSLDDSNGDSYLAADNVLRNDNRAIHRRSA